MNVVGPPIRVERTREDFRFLASLVIAAIQGENQRVEDLSSRCGSVSFFLCQYASQVALTIYNNVSIY